MFLLKAAGATSVLFDLPLFDSTKSDGSLLTGLTSSSTGLKIETRLDTEVTGVSYTVSGNTIESITTVGTYAAPTATKIRFKETDVPGVYQIQIADARLTGGKELTLKISGATNLATQTVVLQLAAGLNPDDPVRAGLTALPNANAAANGGLPTVDANNAVKIQSGTGSNQLDLSSGQVKVQYGTSGGQINLSSGNLAGAVPSVTGNVGGNVVGSVASVTGNIGGITGVTIPSTIASSSEVTAIQNNTRTVIVVPDVIERPDSGTQSYKVRLYLYDEVGNMEAPDSTPTIALVNPAGTDRSSRLGAASNPATGQYEWTYTADAADTMEQLLWEFTVVEAGATRKFGRQSIIVDTTAVDFTSADRTKLDAIKTKTDALPATPAATGDAMTLTGGAINSIADQVWDETAADHNTAGSMGNKLNGLGASANPLVLVDTTVASVVDQTHLRLTTAPGADDTYNGLLAVVYDASNANTPSVVRVQDFVDTNNELVLSSAANFTVVAGDGVKVFGVYIPSALQMGAQQFMSVGLTARKNTAMTAYYYAFDSLTGAPKTGDAANLTLYIGGSSQVATFTEVSAGNAPGWYSVPLTSGMVNVGQALCSVKSATANVLVSSVQLKLEREYDPAVDTVDGITYQSWSEAVLAVLTGVTDVSGATIEFKKRDGTTTKVAITMTGDERTASVIS